MSDPGFVDARLEDPCEKPGVVGIESLNIATITTRLLKDGVEVGMLGKHEDDEWHYVFLLTAELVPLVPVGEILGDTSGIVVRILAREKLGIAMTR